MITAEDIVRNNHRNIISVSEDTLIRDAIRLMVNNKVGSVAVTRNDKIIGLWTERDLLRNTMQPGFDLGKSILRDFLTPGVHKVPHTTTVDALYDHFLGLHVRQLLVEKDGQIFGLVSTGDVIRAAMQQQTREMKNLQSYVSLEYYENWKWQEKKR